MDVTVAGIIYPLFFEIIFVIPYFYILYSQGYQKGKNKLRLLASLMILVSFLSIINFINIYNIPLPPNNRVYAEAYGDLLFLRMIYSINLLVNIILIILMIIGLNFEDYLRARRD